jgi:hypothetical protein
MTGIPPSVLWQEDPVDLATMTEVLVRTHAPPR